MKAEQSSKIVSLLMVYPVHFEQNICYTHSCFCLYYWLDTPRGLQQEKNKFRKWHFFQSYKFQLQHRQTPFLFQDASFLFVHISNAQRIHIKWN